MGVFTVFVVECVLDVVDSGVRFCSVSLVTNKHTKVTKAYVVHSPPVYPAIPSLSSSSSRAQ